MGWFRLAYAVSHSRSLRVTGYRLRITGALMAGGSATGQQGADKRSASGGGRVVLSGAVAVQALDVGEFIWQGFVSQGVRFLDATEGTKGADQSTTAQGL